MAKTAATLDVRGMSCSHCENAVKKSLGALDGVDSVSVDLKGGKVTVEYDSDNLTEGDLKNAIEDQGYDVL